MHCFYINLDRDEERRQFLEANFAQHKPTHWDLQRVAAVDADEVRQLNVGGKLAANVKGCFLSHARAMLTAMPVEGHIMILEDDALFGPQSCQVIDGAIRALPEGSWDILFTDLFLIGFRQVARYLLERRGLLAESKNALKLIKINMRISGTTAYVVNRRSREKVLQCVEQARSISLPYDAFLSKKISQDKEIRAYMTFPFATSISHFADNTTVHSSNPDLKCAHNAWNAIRRLMWWNRDVDQIIQNLNRLVPQEDIDKESQALGYMLSICLSKNAGRMALAFVNYDNY